MKKNWKKILSGAASLTMVAASQAAVAETAFTVNAGEAASYDEIANVQGAFSFNQDTVTPADSVFSLFGTAATGLCAKPAFAMDTAEEYTISVNGKINKAYSTTLSQLQKGKTVTRTMMCSCATGSAVAQASITGAMVSDILQLADVQADANAIAFKSADGYKATLPLQYVLDKGAMLVWQIGDEANPAGAQVWMPSTVAKYFTRNVAEIELLTADVNVEGPAADQRAKVNFLNTVEGVQAVGDTLSFTGYADDCGTAITAVEFSMDGGKTWTTCETAGASADKWVCWSFDYVAQSAGTFKLDVRAVTADGTVSPLASSVVFTVA